MKKAPTEMTTATSRIAVPIRTTHGVVIRAPITARTTARTTSRTKAPSSFAPARSPAPAATTSPIGASPGRLRGMLPGLVVDALCPLLAYQFLKHYTSASDVVALGVGALFPALNSLRSLVRQRHLDIIGILVLIGIAGSGIAVLLGGSPRFLLIRESFTGALIGLAFLLSLLLPRPLIFYIARQITSQNEPERAAAFDAAWQHAPAMRFGFRLMTLVWGVGTLGEFVLRVILAFTLPIATVLAVSAVVFPAIYVGLTVWTMLYSQRMRRRLQQASHSAGA
jgi:hypothetical protein